MLRHLNIQRLQWLIVLGLGVFAATSVASVWGELPPRMASHFDVRGRVDGYMPREAFITTLAVVGVSVVMLPLILSALMRFVPNGALNMPNRDYWLAPERRARTLERIAIWGGWFAVATGVLLVVLIELTLRANIAGTGLDGAAANVALGIYFLATMASLVRFTRQLAKPPTPA